MRVIDTAGFVDARMEAAEHLGVWAAFADGAASGVDVFAFLARADSRCSAELSSRPPFRFLKTIVVRKRGSIPFL